MNGETSQNLTAIGVDLIVLASRKEMEPLVLSEKLQRHVDALRHISCRTREEALVEEDPDPDV